MHQRQVEADVLHEQQHQQQSKEQQKEVIKKNERVLFANKFNNLTNSELYAFDLQLTLLRTAYESYKRETVFKPIPNFLNGFDTEKLLKIFRLPPVTTFISVNEQLDDVQVQLFNWLLTKETFKLNTVPVEVALSFVKHQLPIQSPDYVFEVVYSKYRQERFEQLTENNKYNITYAYHGTRLDNLHSILHTGFLGHLNKLSLFGCGTYFSFEPSVSLHYSPFSSVWANSLFGKRLSCLLLCEIIDDPAYVKCATENGPVSRRQAKDSQAGAVPEQYVVVTNNDLARVKYILVYSEPNDSIRSNQTSIIRTFLSNHRFYLCLFIYFVLLLFIGLFNSNMFNFYWRISKRKLNILFGSQQQHVVE